MEKPFSFFLAIKAQNCDFERLTQGIIIMNNSNSIKNNSFCLWCYYPITRGIIITNNSNSIKNNSFCLGAITLSPADLFLPVSPINYPRNENGMKTWQPMRHWSYFNLDFTNIPNYDTFYIYYNTIYYYYYIILYYINILKIQ